MPRPEQTTTDGNITEENKNNSARQASLVSLGTCSNSGSNVSLPAPDQEHALESDQTSSFAPDEGIAYDTLSCIALLSDDESDEDIGKVEDLCEQHMNDDEIGHVTSMIAQQYGFPFNSCGYL